MPIQKQVVNTQIHGTTKMFMHKSLKGFHWTFALYVKYLNEHYIDSCKYWYVFTNRFLNNTSFEGKIVKNL